MLTKRWTKRQTYKQTDIQTNPGTNMYINRHIIFKKIKKFSKTAKNNTVDIER